MSKLFIFLSILIILIISIALIYQYRKAICTQKKGEFIKQNLPKSYGPDSFEKRLEDTKRINEVYNSCLYPWK